MATETSSNVVRILDEYSQLTAVTDLSKIYFVRYAGGGQHCDPTVKYGWAMYFWDTGEQVWRKFAEQESLGDARQIEGGGGSFDPTILEDYLKKVELKSKVDALPITEKVNQLEATVGNLTTRLATAESTLTKLVEGIRGITREDKTSITAYEIYDMLMGVLDAAAEEE